MMMTSKEGRMTYEEFMSACYAFLEHPAAKADSWKLEGSQEFGESFLSCRTLRRVDAATVANFHSELVVDDASNTGTTALDNDDGEENERKQSNFQLLHYRFDVLYSVSHCVPVLYFMISETSGRTLSLEEVWRLFGLQERGDGGSGESLWEVVSLQDHPVLHNPFFCVHPCNNWVLMRQLLHEGKDKPTTCIQFLISWLSIVGSQFGLGLSPAYFQNVSSTNS